MRAIRVVTNESCNQNCVFCTVRRPAERADFVRAAAERVAAAARRAPEELVLAGGEPTLRRDLPSLVRTAKAGGAASVAVETNAAVVDAPSAVALRAAGLDVARVKIPAWGPEYDRLTQDDGGFERLLGGMAALSDAGIRVEALVAVARANVGSVHALPALIAAQPAAVSTLVVSVPQDAERATEMAPLPLAAAAVEALLLEARRVDLGVQLDPGGFLPPCSFSSPGRVAGLYALSPGGKSRPGFEHVPGCAACTVRELCPGMPELALARGDVTTVRPITEDRTRRRLTLISSEAEQIARELVTHEEHRSLDGSRQAVRTVRVQFRCNQACAFCFVSTHLPKPDDADVLAAIEDAGKAGAALALSGGEPTLSPRLAEYVRFAKVSGVREVELQTNAIRLADPALVQDLEAAGVDVAFVSLHGSTAAVSDAVTGAPGTFDATVRGIDRLVASRIGVRLNFVHCALNTADFPDYVRMVAARWPGMTLTVSVVAPSTDLVPLTRELVPRYSEVKPHLAEGIALARRLGLPVTGFESMCAVPLCLVPEEVREYLLLPEVAAGSDGGGEFVKAGACEQCRVSSRCFGVRKRYAALHGTAELSPV